MANLKDINYGIGKYLEASDASALPDIETNRKNLDLLNFKVATNNAYALYNFKDGMIDAYQTESGVDTGTSTNESYDSTNKLYSPTIIAAATTAFTSTGAATYTCPAGITQAEILIVAGGGGGGGKYRGGGGGAGGVVHDTDYTLVPSTVYDLSVGAGGAGGGSGATGSTGTNSVWNVNAEGSGITLTAGGGGFGGQNPNSGTGGDGGSGGGAYENGAGTSQGGDSNQASFPGAASYGYGGGDSPDESGGGGGGGASQAGQTTAGLAYGGYGGAGKEFTSFGAYGTDSSNTSGATPGSGSGKGYFAGGGGGGSYPPPGNTGGVGGVGGGGRGSYYNPTSQGTAGFVNTGGGGSGGAHDSTDGTTGGSGIILIKTAEATTNMTIESNAQTAQADPAEGRLMLYEEDVDSISLDVDLKGWVSRDGGTTYTQTLLVEDTSYEIFNQGGIDSYTALMLNFDGANNGTTFTDTAPSPHTVVPVGNAKTVTAQKKFGTASGYFDGTGDYLTIATGSDNSFVMGTGNFTVDFWAYDVKVADSDSTVIQIGRGPYGACIGYVHSGGNFVLYLASSNGGWGIASAVSMGALPGAAWAHYALVRNGNTWTTYKDGTQVSQFSSSASLYVADENVQIGRYTYTDNSTNEMEGYVDELRVDKGVARWTADFTPPSYAYTTGAAQTTQRFLSGSVDISGQPSGTNMKYKVETLNGKNLKLHGASLLWA